MQSVTDSASGNECYVAQITGAEVASAIIRRLRRGDLTPADAATALAGFEADFRQNLVLLENSLPRVRDAMALIRRHGLRGMTPRNSRWRCTCATVAAPLGVLTRCSSPPTGN